MQMKKCRLCGDEYSITNSNGTVYKRNICRKCRSRQVTKYNSGNEKRKAYMRTYIRKVGIVKEWPCEICGRFCIKKYRHAFCSDICRFMFYVDILGNCWLWRGYKNKKGYGRFYLQQNNNMIAHRAAYLLFKGEIPVNKFVCHSCDNPSCVKPEHLWLGNHEENMTDMAKKNRASHKLSINDVKNIKTIIRNRIMRKIDVARLYNISAGHLTNILKERFWKYIE